jgi:hypothetical protein
LILQTNGNTTALTLNTDQSANFVGNLLVGTTSAGNGKISLAVSSGGGWFSSKTGAFVENLFGSDSSGNASIFTTGNNHTIKFYTNNTERANINSSGAWSFGATGTATGTNGQILVSAGNAAPPTWTTLSALPTQTGNSGKLLTTDGTTASWAPAPVTFSSAKGYFFSSF